MFYKGVKSCDSYVLPEIDFTIESKPYYELIYVRTWNLVACLVKTFPDQLFSRLDEFI